MVLNGGEEMIYVDKDVVNLTRGDDAGLTVDIKIDN